MYKTKGINLTEFKNPLKAFKNRNFFKNTHLTFMKLFNHNIN